MKFPDKLDVLALHSRLITETGGTPGLRNDDLLESALAAAEMRSSYEEADAIACAATYAYHLTQAHAFFDGNKRIAAAVAETFLLTHGVVLEMSNSELVTLFLNIAAGLINRDEVERLLRTRTTTEVR